VHSNAFIEPPLFAVLSLKGKSYRYIDPPKILLLLVFYQQKVEFVRANIRIDLKNATKAKFFFQIIGKI
jgi:hypothetical protein